MNNQNINYNKSLYKKTYMDKKEYWISKIRNISKNKYYFLPQRFISNEVREICLTKTLERDLTEKVKSLSKFSDIAIYTIILSALKVVFLKKLSMDSGIVSSFALKSNKNEKINELIVLQDSINEKWTFKQLILEVKETILSANKYSDFPLSILKDELNIYDEGINDIVVSMENIHEITDIQKHNVKLFFNFKVTEDYIHCDIRYNEAIFSTEKILTIINDFEKVLEQGISNLNITIDNIEVCEKEIDFEWLNYFNNTNKSYPNEKNIMDLFEEQVKKIPNNVAVKCGEEEITYLQLNEKSNQLARYLTDKGVKREVVVGIMMERSIDLIVAIFAVLKAGGACLPINFELPNKRIQYMLKDCRSSIVIMKDIYKKNDFDDNIHIINLNKCNETIKTIEKSNLNYFHKEKDFAYIIYTSGSTGEPKGVIVEHGALSNRLSWFNDECMTKNESKILFKTAITFDVSIIEIFGWIGCKGQAVIIKDGDEKDVYKIIEVINKEKVSCINYTPSAFRAISRDFIKYPLKSLETIFFVGEKLDMDIVKNIWDSDLKCEIVNLYGPTETIVYATGTKINKGDNEITIGKPLPNTTIYVLNEKNEIIPMGKSGELCIGGKSLARGYLNSIKLTDEKFIDNPYVKGGRLYKTGDLVKLRRDGNIEFIDRIDGQVKIRGFRIEIGEIENKMRNHEIIKDVIVVVNNEEKNKFLIAYYTTKEGIESEDKFNDEIIRFLKSELPEYMIPSFFIRVEEIPLTINGKVDKKSLPDIRKKLNKNYMAPKNQVECNVETIWKQVLGIDTPISVNEDFFRIGGNSLKAIEVVANLKEILGMQVSISKILKLKTIEEISEYILRESQTVLNIIEKTNNKKYYIASAAQKRMYILNQYNPDDIVYNIPQVLKINGKLNISKVKDVFLKIINRHEALRTSFKIIESDVVQSINFNTKIDFQYLKCESNKVDHEIRKFIRPFNLEEAPLFRILVVESDIENFILAIDTHHIVVDGYSLNIIMKEFERLYQNQPVDEIEIQYKDYSEWLLKQDFSKQKEYWMKVFKDEIKSLSIINYDKKNHNNNICGILNKKIDKEIINKLNIIAMELQVDLFTLLLSAYLLMLSKICNQDDITIGVPVLGRHHMKTNKIIGMFVNTIPLRSYPKKDKKIKDFIIETHRELLTGYDNQDFQLDDILDIINAKRINGVPVLCETMFSLWDVSSMITKINGLKIEYENIERKNSMFCIALEIQKNNEGYTAEFEYDETIFDTTEIGLYCKYYFNYLEAFINSVNLKIEEA